VKSALGINAANAKLLLGNYMDAPVNNIKGSSVSLRPYEALVYKL
jgi:hypothetical protein